MATEIKKIISRRDTAANWQSNNPVLANGEIGVDTTNQVTKIGDGVTPWSLLPYSSNRVVNILGDRVDVVPSQKCVTDSIRRGLDPIRHDVDRLSDMYSRIETSVSSTLEKYKPIEINGDVVNAADEEDITSIGGLLKLKDRPNVNSYGYKILRKGEPVQSQITDTHTIYEIRYDLDLDGGAIDLPIGSILSFRGGSISNATLNGDVEIDNVSNARIFSNVSIPKLLGVSRPEWFGAAGNGVDDDTIPVQESIKNSKMTILGAKVYCIKNIDLHSNFCLAGESLLSTLKCLDYTGKKELKHYINIGFRDYDYEYNDLSSMHKQKGTIENVEMKNITFDGNRENISLVFYSIAGCYLDGGSLRNVHIHHCNFVNPVNNCLMFQSCNDSSKIDNILVESCKFICRGDFNQEFTDGSGVIYKIVGDGVYFRNEVAVNTGAITATNIRTINCYGEGLRTLADYKNGCSNGVIYGCVTKNIHDCDHSVDGSDNIVISGCHCYADPEFLPIMGETPGVASTNAIEINGVDITVDNVTVQANGRMRDGIFITNYNDSVASNISIRNCDINNVTGQGIRSLSISKLVIENNVINGYTTHGISIGTGSEKVSIIGNSLTSAQYVTHIFAANSPDVDVNPEIYVADNTFNGFPALIACEATRGGQYAYINRISSNGGDVLNLNSEMKLYRNKYQNKLQARVLSFGNTYPSVADYSLMVNKDNSYDVDNARKFGIIGNGLYLSFWAKGQGAVKVLSQCWGVEGWVKNITKTVNIDQKWRQYTIVIDFNSEITSDVTGVSFLITSPYDNFVEISKPLVSDDYVEQVSAHEVAFSPDYTTAPELGSTDEVPSYNTAPYNLGKSFFDTTKDLQIIWGLSGWRNPDGTLIDNVTII